MLAAAAAMATAALFPYLLQLMPDAFAKLPVPLWVVVIAQSMQAAVLLGGGCYCLACARATALASVRHCCKHGWAANPPRRQHRACSHGWPLHWVPAVPCWCCWRCKASTRCCLPCATRPHGDAATSALNGLLASFYGGIAEELQLCLFLMTLVVWLVARLRKRMPGDASFHVAIMLAALLFGIGPTRPPPHASGGWTPSSYCAPCFSMRWSAASAAGCIGGAAWKWPSSPTSAPTSCCSY